MNYQQECEKKYNKLSEVVKSELEKNNPRKEVGQQSQVHTGSFVALIDEAKDFAKMWNKTIENVDIDHCIEDDYGSSYSKLFLQVNGLETDLQYHLRLLQIHETTLFREERDREDFKRLSAKFAK